MQILVATRRQRISAARERVGSSTTQGIGASSERVGASRQRVRATILGGVALGLEVANRISTALVERVFSNCFGSSAWPQGTGVECVCCRCGCIWGLNASVVLALVIVSASSSRKHLKIK